MRQTHHLQPNEKFGKKELIERLHAKIDEIEWDLAKLDIAMFIPDKQRVEIWSSTFFHDLVSHIHVEDAIQ